MSGLEQAVVLLLAVVVHGLALAVAGAVLWAAERRRERRERRRCRDRPGR